MLQFLIKNRLGEIVFFSGHYYHTIAEAITNGNWHIRDYYDGNFADYYSEVGDNDSIVDRTIVESDVVFV